MALESEDMSDQRQTEASLLDLTFDAILVRDFATDAIQFWNHGAEVLYGFTRDEAIGRVSHDLLRTAHPIPLDEARAVLLETGRWEGELVHATRDGSRIVAASRWALQTAGGRPIAILETNTDITERARIEQERLELLARERRARAQAEEAQTRLAVLANASALLATSLDYETTLQSLAHAVVPQIADWCAVHLVDEDGTVRQITVTHPDPAKVEIARELEQRYPYDPDAPAGVPQVLRTGRPELVSAVSDELLETLTPDAELLRVLRELGFSSWMVVPLAARGRLLGAITLVAAESGRHYRPDDVALAEVLARRAALAVDNARLYQEAQRVAAERSTILSQMTDGIILCDPNGVVTFMNETARRLYGRDFLGHSLAEYRGATTVMDPGGERYGVEDLPLHRALAYGEVTIDAEARLRRTDGSEIIVQRSATPVTAAGGTRLGAVLTVRDVTAQRSLERQKEEFLAALAHDLKTPLTTLKGLAQMLQRRMSREGGASPEQIQEGLARIEQSTGRMTSLINELLDLSRLQMGQGLDLNRRPTDLVVLISRGIAEYREAAGNRPIILETCMPELTGTWDADRLERVIGNLLSNAVKYSPGDTPITVTVRREEVDDGAWAVFSVADRGIGIPQADLPHIFERFHRARNVGRETMGTGIGLAGARQIVEQHGGTIEVRSEEGRGSTFTVHLPLSPEKAGVSE
jgi:PAS domain S-box-containing protein